MGALKVTVAEFAASVQELHGPETTEQEPDAMEIEHFRALDLFAAVMVAQLVAVVFVDGAASASSISMPPHAAARTATRIKRFIVSPIVERSIPPCLPVSKQTSTYMSLFNRSPCPGNCPAGRRVYLSMMLAEVQTAELGQGAITVLVTCVAIPALGALVKWWMAGTARDIRTVGEEVKEVRKDIAGVINRQGEDRESIGILKERTSRLREDLDNLHHSIERRKP